MYERKPSWPGWMYRKEGPKTSRHTWPFSVDFWIQNQKDRKCTRNITFRLVRATIFAVKEQKVWHIMCVCVCVALGIQYVVRRIVTVACAAPEYFSTLSHKWHDCRKKTLLNIKRVSYVYWTVHHCDSWRIKDQPNVTCYFISLLTCSTCFGR